jgi:hypothetical protein
MFGFQDIAASGPSLKHGLESHFFVNGAYWEKLDTLQPSHHFTHFLG